VLLVLLLPVVLLPLVVVVVVVAVVVALLLLLHCYTATARFHWQHFIVHGPLLQASATAFLRALGRPGPAAPHRQNNGLAA
jgi:hypothetical protein